jgi:hypothetical protein
VLTTRWFGQLVAIVNAWNPEQVFSLDTHTAFMGYCDDVILYGGKYKYLQTLDEAFDRLSWDIRYREQEKAKKHGTATQGSFL